MVASEDHWTVGAQDPEPARRACRVEGDNIDQSQVAEVVVVLETEAD